MPAYNGHSGRMSPEIELIVTDLDGTLWDTTVTVQASTKSALHSLAAQQVPVIAATGRRSRGAFGELQGHRLDISAGILLNGALGVHFGSGERFHSRSLG